MNRGLSPGNLYLYIDSDTGEKRGTVGDLEFVKRVGTGGVCDMQIVRHTVAIWLSK